MSPPSHLVSVSAEHPALQLGAVTPGALVPAHGQAAGGAAGAVLGQLQHTQECGAYSTVQYSTVQYSTVQYSTVQYSSVQYSTVQLLHLPRQPRLLLLRQLLQPPPARLALQHDLGALDKLRPSTGCFHIVRRVIALKILLVKLLIMASVRIHLICMDKMTRYKDHVNMNCFLMRSIQNALSLARYCLLAWLSLTKVSRSPGRSP